MRVIVADSAGFCFGVRRAVERAEAVAAEAGRAFTDGPLIHNPGMLKELESKGIRVAGEETPIPEDGVLIIRAHGIPPERRKSLQARARRLIDATCPEVARIQGKIRAQVAKGRTVLILGDAGHAEVVGLLGHAGDSGRVVGSVADVEALEDVEGDVSLVSQSTQDGELFRDVAEAVTRRFPGAEVIDTICDATKRRQRELRSIAETVDKLVVVGSKTSANTRRLAEIAAALRPTVWVARAEELRAEDFIGARTVGVTAGASTPDPVIRDVRAWLESQPEGGGR